MQESYNLLLCVILLYGIWIPLAFFSVKYEMKKILESIPKKVKNPYKHKGKEKRNRQIEKQILAVKKEYSQYYSIAFIPMVNIVTFFTIFGNKKL